MCKFLKKISLLGHFWTHFHIKTQDIIRELNFLVQDSLKSAKANQTRILFSKKHRLDIEVANVINKAESFVFFAQLDFAIEEISNALTEAIKRGVKVCGIIERRMAIRNPQREFIKNLCNAGANIVVSEEQPGWMHLKILITEKEAISGSYNWTKEATFDNEEILEIFNDNKTRWQLLEIFNEVFSKHKNV